MALSLVTDVRVLLTGPSISGRMGSVLVNKLALRQHVLGGRGVGKSVPTGGNLLWGLV
jgi:hypothetical protein